MYNYYFRNSHIPHKSIAVVQRWRWRRRLRLYTPFVSRVLTLSISLSLARTRSLDKIVIAQINWRINMYIHLVCYYGCVCVCGLYPLSFCPSTRHTKQQSSHLGWVMIKRFLAVNHLIAVVVAAYFITFIPRSAAAALRRRWSGRSWNDAG